MCAYNKYRRGVVQSSEPCPNINLEGNDSFCLVKLTHSELHTYLCICFINVPYETLNFSQSTRISY